MLQQHIKTQHISHKWQSYNCVFPALWQHIEEETHMDVRVWSPQTFSHIEYVKVQLQKTPYKQITWLNSDNSHVNVLLPFMTINTLKWFFFFSQCRFMLPILTNTMDSDWMRNICLNLRINIIKKQTMYLCCHHVIRLWEREKVWKRKTYEISLSVARMFYYV